MKFQFKIAAPIISIYCILSLPAFAQISIVPASPVIGPLECKPDHLPPQCNAIPYSTNKNLAFPGNGYAQPAVTFDQIPQHEIIHQPQFANDGFYGNGASWVSNSAYSWIKIDLGRETLIGSIQFGRDRTGGFNDRDPGQFTIEVALSDNIYANGDASNDEIEYTLIFNSETYDFNGVINLEETLRASFPPITTKFIKITTSNYRTDIDEIEVFAPTYTAPPSILPRILLLLL